MDPSSTSAIGSKPDTTSGAQRPKFPPQTPLPNLQCCTASLWARSRVCKLQLAEMEPRPPLGALIPQNPGACQTTSRHSLWWPALYRPPQVGAFQLCCPFPSIILPQLWQFLSFFFFLKKCFYFFNSPLSQRRIMVFKWCYNRFFARRFAWYRSVLCYFFSLSTETQCPPPRWLCVAPLSCPYFSILSDPLRLDH